MFACTNETTTTTTVNNNNNNNNSYTEHSSSFSYTFHTTELSKPHELFFSVCYLGGW